LGKGEKEMAKLSLGEEIEQELSQYASALLAYKSWGTIAVEKAHMLKVESAKNIAILTQKRIDGCELTDEEIMTSDEILINDPEWNRLIELEQHEEGYTPSYFYGRKMLLQAQLDKIKKEIE
jgi:hypothetical protein